MILFCALLQMQWCSFKESDFKAGICFRGQLKCVCFHRSLPNFWIQYPLNPLTLQFAHVDCPCSRSGISDGCCSSKLPGSCFNTAVSPLCLKCFFLISPLICKYIGLRAVHVYKQRIGTSWACWAETEEWRYGDELNGMAYKVWSFLKRCWLGVLLERGK